MTSESGSSLESARLEDFARETGTLFFALAPLDAMLWEVRYPLLVALTYMLIGLALVRGATVLERRRIHGRK